MPVPEYPVLQAHQKEPCAFVHFAIPGAQLCWPDAHSSKSPHPLKPMPLPVYPALHEHAYEPAALEHEPIVGWQL